MAQFLSDCLSWCIDASHQYGRRGFKSVVLEGSAIDTLKM